MEKSTQRKQGPWQLKAWKKKKGQERIKKKTTLVNIFKKLKKNSVKMKHEMVGYKKNQKRTLGIKIWLLELKILWKDWKIKLQKYPQKVDKNTKIENIREKE